MKNVLNHAVITADGWKLQEDQLATGTVTQRLFDLVNDPLEIAPIDPDTHPDQTLVEWIRQWLIVAQATIDERRSL